MRTSRPAESGVQTQDAAALDRLESELTAHLAAHLFLRFAVLPEALCFEGETLPHPAATPGILAPLLHSGDIVELYFKAGLGRTELERFVTALQQAPFGVQGAESVTTRLWECELRRIAFRCPDDLLLAGTDEDESFDFANVPVARADELVADVSRDPSYSAAAAIEALPGFDLDSLPDPLRRILHHTDADEAELRALLLPDADEALARLVRLLVGVIAAETDAGARELAGDALARLADRELEAGRFDRVRDLLASLSAAAAPGAPDATAGPGDAETVARLLCATLCTQPHLVRLGTLLDRSRPAAALAPAAREIAAWLAAHGFDRLWELFTALHDVNARDHAADVLAVACAPDPRAFVERTRCQSWNEVRDLVSVLGRVGGPRVLPLLGRWRNHADPRVRLEIVRALGPMPEHAAAAILAEMLSDGERRVRQSALWALAARSDARLPADLRQIILEERFFRELASDERDDFFRAYGRIADEDAVLELAELLQQRSVLGMGWKAELRRGAAIALGESRWPGAHALLEQHADSRDGRVADACRQALRALQDAGHRDPVVPEDVAPEAVNAAPGARGSRDAD